jgi:hypothetical protein
VDDVPDASTGAGALVPDDCVAPCVVEAAFPAVAEEPAVFAWVTSPSEPGLRTRIDTFVFDGSSCFAAEAAIAPWSVPADWSAVWIGWPEGQPQGAPDCDCVAV